MNIDEKSEQVYQEIIGELSKVSEREMHPTVRLYTTDVKTTGFWAKVYEDVVAGIRYQILDKKNTELLAVGTIPLHKAPWQYERTSLEINTLLHDVGKRIALFPVANGALNIVGTTIGNLTEYCGFVDNLVEPKESDVLTRVVVTNNYDKRFSNHFLDPMTNERMLGTIESIREQFSARAVA